MSQKKDQKAKAHLKELQEKAAKRKSGVVYKDGKWSLVEDPKYFGGGKKK